MLTLSNNALHDFFSIAFLILNGFVTSKSSPTFCTLIAMLKADQASQSSWSNGSSMEQISYFSK